MIKFELNGQAVETSAEPDTPLLWIVRDYFHLTGSKFGCGMGLCGACSMHLEGESVRTCILPVSAVEGRSITTIEGLGTPENLHVVQQAWIENSAAQCGYCQSGQVMSAAALLAKNPNPSDEEIDSAMSGNICRCGTYHAIRRAIKSAAEKLQAVQPVSYYDPKENSVGNNVEEGIQV